MAKLHWIVFVIAGITLTFGSWMIDKEKLILFFYAGFIFLLIGTIKFIFRRPSKAPEAKISHKSIRGYEPSGNIKYCSNCGLSLRSDANFCSRCRKRI